MNEIAELLQYGKVICGLRSIYRSKIRRRIKLGDEDTLLTEREFPENPLSTQSLVIYGRSIITNGKEMRGKRRQQCYKCIGHGAGLASHTIVDSSQIRHGQCDRLSA